MHNQKLGKKDDFLHCIDKGDVPQSTLHIDHLGTLDATSKSYKYIFAVVDGFSKYTWIYPTKTTETQEVVRHLESWVTIFGSPQRIISDKGTAYTSKMFKEFCSKYKIEHVEITAGVPRSNGQQQNRTSGISTRHKYSGPLILTFTIRQNLHHLKLYSV
ncbi:uncharacterized protein K02A2.6-like [Bactrocera neohumeralis]|uniref:uncharacterized protein K02A2.6-like n=1 Tax=Bactrocera neohumeralis TaxID=98809 RepID=UPI00216672F1|nr:uncharacterized protein K02A2.6-like [Bactrocera neohumeralis]